jgi:hypothetical protein
MMECIRLAAAGNQQHRQAHKAKMNRTGASPECERASMSRQEDSSLGDPESWDLQQSRWICKYSRFQAVPSAEVISMRPIFLRPEFLPLLLLFVTVTVQNDCHGHGAERLSVQNEAERHG